ncbi:MAG: hypothetical protein BYD32DRAFT_404113 [Podila humilis]|nr:MAG: hypothetical protein BYD32DRAFT_404113 [Podila humilis]
MVLNNLFFFCLLGHILTGNIQDGSKSILHIIAKNGGLVMTIHRHLVHLHLRREYSERERERAQVKCNRSSL